MGALEKAPLAVFKRRQLGEITVAALDSGSPPLFVAFEVPTGLKVAEGEAAAARAMATLRDNPEILRRYGLPERALTDAETFALGRIATAVEFAVLLWREWTYSRAGVDDGPAPLEPEVIGELLADQHIRAAWMMQLDAASPLERAEGNASGVSPNGSSEEAPNTAEAASGAEAPAPAAAEAEPAISAPD
jgi:hypothetical protein